MPKNLCEAVPKISVFNLRRRGYLKGESRAVLSWNYGLDAAKSSIEIGVNVLDPKPYVRLKYRLMRSEGPESFDYVISLTRTCCHLGGIRYYFICPNESHGLFKRRAAILYLDHISGRFICRKCAHVLYQSQYDVPHRRFLEIFADVMWIEERLERSEAKIRIKQSKGRPTKRYRRFLKKVARLQSKESKLLNQIRKK